jgi:hypothetical protein
MSLADLLPFVLAAYKWLANLHPMTPFVVLAGILFSVDKALDRAGATAWLRSKVPSAPAMFDRLPVVVLGAAWGAITVGDLDPLVAVGGALSAIAVPVLNEARKWLAIAVVCILGTGGCGLLAPKYSDAELECLARAEAEADLMLAACANDHFGPCSTRAIIAKQRDASHMCVEGAK